MRLLLPLLLLSNWFSPQHALAWGDDGHKIVALIAEHYLLADARAAVLSILATGTDELTTHDIASAATWADKYRDQNQRRDHYEQTKRWHFVDLEIDNPDLNAACLGRRPLPVGTLASNGPSMACIVDKIEQFAAELAAPKTDAEERLLALKFLLHLLGDLHQPLHCADNHDHGGNDITVIAEGIEHHSRDELHGYWDIQFVQSIAGQPKRVTETLLAQITLSRKQAWEQGIPEDWAMETHFLAKRDAYGNPPLSKGSIQRLDSAYADRAKRDISAQLIKAGVRLAHVLNEALGSK
jgi:S1/P1 Nuclease